MSQDISEALIAYLQAEPSIAALLSGRFSPGIEPPDTARPYATYLQIDRPTERGLHGEDMPHPRIQLTFWSKRKRQVNELAALVRARLAALRAKIAAQAGVCAFGDFLIQAVWTEDERDLDEAPDDGSASTDFGRQIDVIIWIDE